MEITVAKEKKEGISQKVHPKKQSQPTPANRIQFGVQKANDHHRQTRDVAVFSV
jgi:hypothetical protein